MSTNKGNKKEAFKQIPQLTTKILQKHPYIEKIIKVSLQDPKRFECIICTKNLKNTSKEETIVGGQFKWLKKHLSTETHRSFTAKDEMKELNEAIKALGRRLRPPWFRLRPP